MEQMTVPRMVTIKEAAAQTGMSYDAIRKMCLNNQIIYVKAGAKFLVNFGKLVEYLNTGEQNGTGGNGVMMA